MIYLGCTASQDTRKSLARGFGKADTSGLESVFIKKIAYSPVNNNYVALADAIDTGLEVCIGYISGGLTVGSPLAGVDWEEITDDIGGYETLIDLLWCSGIGKYIALYNSEADEEGKIRTSSDGITWSYDSVIPMNYVQSMTYSPTLNRLIVVGNNYDSIEDIESPKVYYSSDALTWTEATTNPSVLYGWGCAWGDTATGGVFCILSNDYEDVCSYSSDGITWADGTPPSGSYWRNICFSPELSMFAAQADSDGGAIIATSPDGIVWTDRVTEDLVDMEGLLTSIVWINEIGSFICTNDTASPKYAFYKSSDGITWSKYNPIDETDTFNTITGCSIWNGKLRHMVSTMESEICISL